MENPIKHPPILTHELRNISEVITDLTNAGYDMESSDGILETLTRLKDSAFSIGAMESMPVRTSMRPAERLTMLPVKDIVEASEAVEQDLIAGFERQAHKDLTERLQAGLNGYTQGLNGKTTAQLSAKGVEELSVVSPNRMLMAAIKAGYNRKQLEAMADDMHRETTDELIERIVDKAVNTGFDRPQPTRQGSGLNADFDGGDECIQGKKPSAALNDLIETFLDVDDDKLYGEDGKLTPEARESMQNVNVEDAYPNTRPVVDVDVSHAHQGRVEAEPVKHINVGTIGHLRAPHRTAINTSILMSLAGLGATMPSLIRGLGDDDRNNSNLAKAAKELVKGNGVVVNGERYYPGDGSKEQRREMKDKIILQFDEGYSDYNAKMVAEMRDVVTTLGILIAMEKKAGNKRINTYIRNYCREKADKMHNNPLQPMLKEITKHQLCEAEVAKLKKALDIIDRVAEERKHANQGALPGATQEDQQG